MTFIYWHLLLQVPLDVFNRLKLFDLPLINPLRAVDPEGALSSARRRQLHSSLINCCVTCVVVSSARRPNPSFEATPYGLIRRSLQRHTVLRFRIDDSPNTIQISRLHDRLAGLQSYWYPAELLLGLLCALPLGPNQRHTSVQFKRPQWKVTLGQIDWNGSWCGVETTKVKIHQFRAPRQINRLVLRPLALAGADEQEIRHRVLARGKRFESLRGYHLMVCRRRKFVLDQDAAGNTIEVAQPINGRVAVDAFAYYLCQKEMPPSLPRLVNDSDAESGTSASGLLPEPMHTELGERHEDLRPLTDEERLLAVPLVKELDLATKTWCTFAPPYMPFKH